MRNNFSSRPAPRRRQSGIALLALSVLLVIVSVGLLVEKLSTRTQGNSARERSSNEVLAQAKASLIAWSVSHPNEPGRLPWPDRNGDGDYDGGSDCVTTGFSNVHLLGRFPHAGDATPCDVVPFGSFTVDGYGEPLWYAVSQNLLWNRGQTGTDPPLNPGLLDGAASYPWLTVRDESGNVMSNRVAAVIIAPGGIVGNQARTGPAPNPSQYLDSVTIGATTYDNSDADLDFIVYPDSRKTTTDGDSFNDQLIYITIDELMRPVEKRVLGDAAVALEDYRNIYGPDGYYPWLSPYRDPLSASGGQTLTGRIESASGGGDKITDDDADFVAAGVQKDDTIVNLTRRTITTVKKVKSPTELDLHGSPDFDAGHAYNLRPAFNGVWGGTRTTCVPPLTASGAALLGSPETAARAIFPLSTHLSRRATPCPRVSTSAGATAPRRRRRSAGLLSRGSFSRQPAAASFKIPTRAARSLSHHQRCRQPDRPRANAYGPISIPPTVFATRRTAIEILRFETTLIRLTFYAS